MIILINLYLMTVTISTLEFMFSIIVVKRNPYIIYRRLEILNKYYPGESKGKRVYLKILIPVVNVIVFTMFLWFVVVDEKKLEEFLKLVSGTEV